MTRPFNPRSAALAYRIWAYCTPRGWNCTVSEVADELGEPFGKVNAICRDKKWFKRMRGSLSSKFDTPTWLVLEVDGQGPVKL